MRLRSQSGFGLILLVAVISVSTVLLYASGRMFEDSMRETQLRIDQAKAYYLAQAGVVRAAWDWYKSNTTTDTSRRWSSLNTTVAGNMLFKAGSDSAGALLHSNFAYYTQTSDPIISYVKNVGTNTNQASGNTTLAVTVPVAGVAQGNFLAVYFAEDADGTNPTCADTRGNTYTRQVNASSANTNAVARLAIFTAPVTTALVSGDTITVSWTTATVAEAMSVSEFVNVDVLDVTPVTATGSSTAPTTGNAATTYRETLLIGGIASEGPVADTFTAGANYLTAPPTRAGTSLATATSNVTINPEYRIVSATGNYLANGTITSRDWAAAIVPMRAAPRWATFGGTNRRLRFWQIYNINNGNSITLDKMKVSWTGGGTARLTEIRLNNTSVWTGTGTTGSLLDITDTVIANGGSIGGINTYLQWNNSGPADPVAVTCQFIYSGDSSTSDAKSHEVILWDGAQSGAGLKAEKTFAVVSTGQVDQTSGGRFKVLKTVKAVVSAAPGASALEIVDWDEGDKNIP